LRHFRKTLTKHVQLNVSRYWLAYPVGGGALVDPRVLSLDITEREEVSSLDLQPRRQQTFLESEGLRQKMIESIGTGFYFFGPLNDG
jgi:hypothetical protein